MTPEFGIVDAVSASSGDSPLRLRVRLGDELLRDVIAITPLRTTTDIAKGDRVLVFQDAAGTGERYAWPMAIAARNDAWRLEVDGAELVLEGGTIAAQSASGTSNAVPTMADFQALVTWLKSLTLKVITLPNGSQVAGPPELTNQPPSPSGTQVFRAE